MEDVSGARVDDAIEVLQTTCMHRGTHPAGFEDKKTGHMGSRGGVRAEMCFTPSEVVAFSST
jgi:hypothetical protein